MSSAVDIVIVSFNTRELLHACLDAARAHAPGANVFVVDNASGDGSPEMVAQDFPDVHLIRSPENVGFGAANNLGIAAGSAPYILFLNSDAELTPRALPLLAKALDRDPQAVMAGPRLEGPDGVFQPSCRRIPNAWRYAWSLSGLGARLPWLRALDTWYSETEHHDGTRPGMLSGACFLARRDYLAAIGNFDPRLFLYEEETDIAIPAHKRGLHMIYVRGAHVIHHGGASVAAGDLSAFSERHMYRSKYLCFHKHYGPGHAKLAHTLDTRILRASARRQAKRGATGTAQASLDRCEAAWAEYLALVNQ